MPFSTGSRASIGGVSGVCGDHLRLVDCLPRFESTLENILKLVMQEVSASLDREAYLLRKIKDLSSQLQALQSQFELLQRPQPDCEKAQDADTQDENLKIPKKKDKKAEKQKREPAFPRGPNPSSGRQAQAHRFPQRPPAIGTSSTTL